MLLLLNRMRAPCLSRPLALNIDKQHPLKEAHPMNSQRWDTHHWAARVFGALVCLSCQFSTPLFSAPDRASYLSLLPATGAGAQAGRAEGEETLGLLLGVPGLVGQPLPLQSPLRPPAPAPWLTVLPALGCPPYPCERGWHLLLHIPWLPHHSLWASQFFQYPCQFSVSNTLCLKFYPGFCFLTGP